MTKYKVTCDSLVHSRDRLAGPGKEGKSNGSIHFTFYLLPPGRSAFLSYYRAKVGKTNTWVRGRRGPDSSKKKEQRCQKHVTGDATRDQGDNEMNQVLCLFQMMCRGCDEAGEAQDRHQTALKPVQTLSLAASRLLQTPPVSACARMKTPQHQ